MKSVIITFSLKYFFLQNLRYTQKVAASLNFSSYTTETVEFKRSFKNVLFTCIHSLIFWLMHTILLVKVLCVQYILYMLIFKNPLKIKIKIKNNRQMLLISG